MNNLINKSQTTRNRITLTGNSIRVHNFMKAISQRLAEADTVQTSSFTVYLDDNVVVFDTATTNEVSMLKAMSNEHPDVNIEYAWASGNFATKTGTATIINGQITNEVHYDDYSTEAHNLAESVWNDCVCNKCSASAD